MLNFFFVQNLQMKEEDAMRAYISLAAVVPGIAESGEVQKTECFACPPRIRSACLPHVCVALMHTSRRHFRPLREKRLGR